jgi:hypothetical protein
MRIPDAWKKGPHSTVDAVHSEGEDGVTVKTQGSPQEWVHSDTYFAREDHGSARDITIARRLGWDEDEDDEPMEA